MITLISLHVFDALRELNVVVVPRNDGITR